MQKILNPIIAEDLNGTDATFSKSRGDDPVKLSVKLAFQRHIELVTGVEDKFKTFSLGLKIAKLDDYAKDILLEDAELEHLSKLLKNIRNPAFTDIVYGQLEQVLDEVQHVETPS